MTEAQAALGQDLGASENVEEVMLQTPMADVAADAPSPAAEPTTAEPATAAQEAAVAPTLTDIALIDGIGPKFKAALAGGTSLQVMAELTDEKIAEIEAATDMSGKFASGEWVAQAKEIVSGKPPRAKTDQAAAAKA
jgi:predicted flap endonuclease-1-like 5' DNA nuclease